MRLLSARQTATLFAELRASQVLRVCCCRSNESSSERLRCIPHQETGKFSSDFEENTPKLPHAMLAGANPPGPGADKKRKGWQFFRSCLPWRERIAELVTGKLKN